MSEITDPAEPYFKDGVWGWTGNLWRKLPLLWGFSDRLSEDLGGTKDGAGTYSAYTTAVPAGEVHVVQLVSVRNTTRSGTYAGIQLTRTGGDWYLVYDSTPAEDIPLIFTGVVVLEYGDRVRVVWAGCENLDVVQAVVWGYKMKIAE